MSCTTTLLELRSFRKDWMRWSARERLAAKVALAAAVLIMLAEAVLGPPASSETPVLPVRSASTGSPPVGSSVLHGSAELPERRAAVGRRPPLWLPSRRTGSMPLAVITSRARSGRLRIGGVRRGAPPLRGSEPLRPPAIHPARNAMDHFAEFDALNFPRLPGGPPSYSDLAITTA